MGVKASLNLHTLDALPLIAYNTYQVKNYDNFELAGFSEEAKRQWRDEHWEQDLQRAYDAGKRMAEQILD